MELRLRPYLSKDQVIVANFRVAEEQAVFIDSIENTLAMQNERINFVIDVDDMPIGFFQIDHSSGKQSVRDHIELHEVMIDQRYQGKGCGKLFIEKLPVFLRQTFQDAKGVCLTVNCRNLFAKRLYEFGGFMEVAGLKIDGPSGPQFVMRREL